MRYSRTFIKFLLQNWIDKQDFEKFQTSAYADIDCLWMIRFVKICLCGKYNSFVRITQEIFCVLCSVKITFKLNYLEIPDSSIFLKFWISIKFFLLEKTLFPEQKAHRLHMARYLLIDVRFCACSRKHILSKRKHVHTFWNRTFTAENRYNLWQNWHSYHSLDHWSLWEQVSIRSFLPI